MDLSIDIDNYKLNVRTAVIIKLDIDGRGDKYLVCRSTGGHYFTVGGRIKAGETSAFAAARELNEELGIVVAESNLQFITTMEHLFVFKDSGQKAHEPCFMYELINVDEVIKAQILHMLQLDNDEVFSEFALLSPDELKDAYILPEINKDIMLACNAALPHYIADYIIK